MLSKQEAESLMKIAGRTKGSEIITLARYIEEKHGKEGIEALEKKLEELGYPFHFNKIRSVDWYQESLSVLAQITAKNLFNWKDLFDLGYNSPVFSLWVKAFIKLISLPLILKQASQNWNKFMDVGSLEAFGDPKEKSLTIQLKNYMFHPEMCPYYAGFFLRLLEYVIRSKKITIKETKCMFKGDPYHEYTVHWE